MLTYVPSTTKVQAVDEYLRNRETILKELRQNLVGEQARMKAKADQHRRKVLARVGPVVYKLELPAGSQIHDVFHVSLLKQKLGLISPVSQLLPPVSEDSEVLPQPESVIDHRVICKGNYRPKTEILVKWKGAPREDATWENQWLWTRILQAKGIDV
ncbi:hypothetical protein Acr_28g0006740 [Actinidia rufa]|uniref:Chromo domain-containing protein n=1 Tax=Actinidia rufa TaxID=165716 RepID=A0A7J0HA80_9ERIC|nr:hypothetical protein Acr_28g0006740 [Actinidia rufa]